MLHLLGLKLIINYFDLFVCLIIFYFILVVGNIWSPTLIQRYYTNKLEMCTELGLKCSEADRKHKREADPNTKPQQCILKVSPA